MNADAAAGPDHGPRHDHVVGFYERDADLIASVARFLSGALDDGGTAVVIATASHRAAIADALGGRGYSLTELTTAGRYRAFDAAETLAQLMRGNRPEREAFLATVAPILDELADRTAPLHAFGEMVGLLWDAGNVAAAMELERFWNDLAGPRGFSLYCGYAMSSIEAAGDLGAAKDICDQHSEVVALHDPLARAHDSLGPAARDTYERLFIATPSALSRVRTFVREALHVWGDDELFDVAGIIGAELATNAMVHARSPFRVRVSRSAAAIRIGVQDTSVTPPEQLDFDHNRSGGRGIAIVAALARTWGTESVGTGKIVWAELARDPAYSAT